MQLLLLEQEINSILLANIPLQFVGTATKSLKAVSDIIYKSTTCLFFYQRTPLHIAANKGFRYTVETLVKRGANIKIKDKNGVSATILLKVD